MIVLLSSLITQITILMYSTMLPVRDYKACIKALDLTIMKECTSMDKGAGMTWMHKQEGIPIMDGGGGISLCATSRSACA